VALFDLVIHAGRKNLDPCFYRIEARTDALEAVIDGMVQIAKLPLAQIAFAVCWSDAAWSSSRCDIARFL
jgi:hypothetical protein